MGGGSPWFIFLRGLATPYRVVSCEKHSYNVAHMLPKRPSVGTTKNQATGCGVALPRQGTRTGVLPRVHGIGSERRITLLPMLVDRVVELLLTEGAIFMVTVCS